VKRNMVRVSAILLGAGESKRMGVNKLTLPWGKKTVLEHCLQTLLQSEVEEVIVVINPHIQKRIFYPLSPKVKVVINPSYQKGMSTSLRKGLEAVDRRSDAILIALGDQPLVKTKTINALVHAFALRKRAIVIPTYRGMEGHPVVFSKIFKEALMEIKGDRGGKSLIKRYPQEIWKVRIRSEGVVKDMDIWKDYKKALRRGDSKVERPAGA
jgi:molybdenum cofactor cytidylyltransferase